MKTIYVFGNPYLEDDNFAHKIAEVLKDKAKFIPLSSPDQLLDVTDDEIVIMDVVRGITQPIIINKIEHLKTRKLCSLHDFDVGYFLNLMKQTGWTKKIKIIGLPQKGNHKEISEKVKEWL